MIIDVDFRGSSLSWWLPYMF